MVPEFGTQRVAVDEVGRVEPGDVTGELEVGLGPVADPGKVFAERVGHDVVGVADEDRPVAQASIARPLLDHLGVVVGGDRGLARTTVGHREPAHEVGHPRELEVLALGILVEEVVDVPGLVADHDVVVLVADEVVEHHEVVDQHLVHLPDGLERVQVVLAGLLLHVGRLAGEERRRGVDSLTPFLQHPGDRVLGEPVDLQVGVQLAELVGDRRVTQRMTEPDRRRDVERPLGTAGGAHPGTRRRCLPGPRADRVDELFDQPVDDDRIARVGAVPSAADRDELAAGQLREGHAGRVRADAVVVAVDDEHGRGDPGTDGSEALELTGLLSTRRIDQYRRWDLLAPLDAVLDLLGGVGLAEHLGEEELGEVAVVLQPVVAVVLGPAVGRVEFGIERVDGALHVPGRERRGRPDRDEPVDALGVVGRELDPPGRAARQRDEDRPLGARRIEHGADVVGELEMGVRLAPDGCRRHPGPTAVERDDPVATGERGDLRLPEPGGDDRPRRQQSDRRLAVPNTSQCRRTPSRSTSPMASGCRALMRRPFRW